MTRGVRCFVNCMGQNQIVLIFLQLWGETTLGPEEARGSFLVDSSSFLLLPVCPQPTHILQGV